MVEYDVSIGMYKQVSDLSIQYSILSTGIYFETLISTVVPFNPGDVKVTIALPGLSSD
jgi:hypothetical protein